MSNATKDRSEVFSPIALHLGAKKAAVVDNSFQLSPNGVAFKTNTSLPTWTEMDVKLRLPSSAAKTSAQQVDCRGVVVHCKKQPKSGVYDVAFLFCDVSPRDQQKLRAASKQLAPVA